MLVAQSVEIDTAAIDAVVEKEMKTQKIVGLAITIIGNGNVVYTKGYGFANLENETAVDENTVFNWASNSKPLIAVATMQLVELTVATSRKLQPRSTKC